MCSSDPAMPMMSLSSVSLDPTACLFPAAGRVAPAPRLRRVVLRAASVSAVAEESSAAAAARGRLESLSQVAGVLGTQWGDEGKGKLVDILAQRFDVVARCQVSPSLHHARSLPLNAPLPLVRMVFEELLPPLVQGMIVSSALGLFPMKLFPSSMCCTQFSRIVLNPFSAHY